MGGLAVGASALGVGRAGGRSSVVGDGPFDTTFGEPFGSSADFRAFVEVFPVVTGGATALTLAFALDKRPTFLYNVPEHAVILQQSGVSSNVSTVGIP